MGLVTVKRSVLRCSYTELCFYSGSLASSIFDPLSALVGASGGVYALMGGYFMNAVVVSASSFVYCLVRGTVAQVKFGNKGCRLKSRSS